MWPLLLLFLVDSGWAQCNPSTVGRAACGQLSASRYTQGHKQWITCLTDSYIQQKSGHRHRCSDRNATECWYQCMIEIYDKTSGDVSGECSCKDEDQLPLVGNPVSDSCFSPSGDSCDWFQDCLVKKHPSCNERTNAYALIHAEKFCNLYRVFNSKFTPVGLKWIDAVRKCLQVSLVPLLRPWKNPTCQQIREKAFDSHTPCYLSPDKGAPSICNLNCTEYLKVFWILKGSYSNLDTAGGTLRGLWNTGMQCACPADLPDSSVLHNPQLIAVTRLTVKKYSTRPKRSAYIIPESDLQQRFADGVSSAIARSLKWNYGAMNWFGFSENNTNTSDPDVSTINLVLADTKSLGISSSRFADRVNLNDTVQQLARAIREGNLLLRVDEAYVWVKSLQICQDTSCNSAESIAVSDTHPTSWPTLLPTIVRTPPRCYASSGPAGRASCVDLSQRYTPGQYQWATCLTDAYIQQKSGHRHHCANRQAKYCWYQCMIEVHGKEGGDVYKDCSCDPRTHLTQEGVVLPDSCFSPSGDSCGWYQNCLERKHPTCGARTNAYALTHAEKFCNLYHVYNSTFTPVGLKWIDAVRKCLQVSLVPLLRAWNKPTCQQIRAKAFESHTPCYLSPDQGAPSICDLNCTEYLKVFWILKGSYSSLDTAGETLKGLWNTGMRCACKADLPLNISETPSNGSEPHLHRPEQQFIALTRLTVKKFTTRPRRFADSVPESDLQQRFADSISSAIARSLKWNYEAMDWFGFSDSSRDVSDSDVSTINLILADTKSLGISSRPFADQVNLNDTVQQLAKAIMEGNLPLRVDGAFVWVKSLQICQDTSCNSTETIAVSDTLPIWPTELTTTESNQTRTTSGCTNLRYNTALLLSLMMMFMLNMMGDMKQA